MLTSGISFINFKQKKFSLKIKKKLKEVIENKNQIIKSLGKEYNYSFKSKTLKKYKIFKDFRVIGMGGSILGSKAIFNFLKEKSKKNFVFIDNLILKKEKYKNNQINLIISKSGNTLETITNVNLLSFKWSDKLVVNVVIFSVITSTNSSVR